MDEVIRLQSLRAAPVAPTAARGHAAFALEQAIGGRRRPLRPTVVVIAFVAAPSSQPLPMPSTKT